MESAVLATGVEHALARAKFNSTFAKEGGKESIEMKSSITSVIVAAILLAGTFAARAQFTEGDVSHPKARSTHH